ncbi:MAG TPA: serine hydrolase domain-containing protein [Dehalococcoidia bacterium]|nr:serine hydrolase domain-containing protein [Dehalococcoidia bacterium]
MQPITSPLETRRVPASLRFSRRRLLGSGLAVGAAVTGGGARLWSATARVQAATEQQPPGASLPVTGQPVPQLVAFDQVIQQVMARWGLKGGALALAKDGRLVFSHAYGLADVEANQPFLPSSLCRIASDSKPFTAMTILRLMDAGRLSLGDKAFRILTGLQPPANASIDPRLDDITIQNLVQHTGGWDSTKSFDPQYPPYTFWEAGTLGVAAPPTAEQIIRFMLSQPLDFTPGTKYVYSNFGYNVLGRVIERITGMSYGDAVQQLVLAPSGISDMLLGRTRLEDRLPGEVRYVNLPDQALVPSVFPAVGYVPNGYGGYYMEALDAHGGWIATAEDQIRLATAVDGQRGTALLKPATVDAMLHTPIPQEIGAAGAGNATPVSGLGWGVRPEGDGLSWSHAGALEGACASWIIRRPDGATISFVFSSLPSDYGSFFGDITPALTKTADGIPDWPAFDLFEGP